jgi:tripartite-type tricarboxylate transporter receptor subunit TctC
MQVGHLPGSSLVRAGVLLGLIAAGCAPARSAAPATTAQPAAPAAQAPAQAPAAQPAGRPFYEGKTIRFIVGLAAGGGYDTYTRTIARHFGKYVPGNPQTVVENMVGASGLLAANNVYRVAPQDGTVIHNYVGGLTTQELLKAPGIEFESTRWQWLGVPTPDSYVCVVRKETGVTSLLDARGRARELIIGGIAPGGSTDDVPKILRAALDLNLKIISGYDGTSKVRLAMEGGEVDGACYAWESWKATSADRIASGEFVVVGQATEKPMADLPNVPLFLDMATNDESRQLILNGVVARSRMERPYLVGPGVPADRVQVLRDAFVQTLKDPDFLDEAKKAKLDIDLVPADEVERRVRDLFALPEPVKARFRTILTGD